MASSPSTTSAAPAPATATAPTTAAASRPAKATVTLRPATEADIPALASISDAACKTDSHTQLKASIRGDDDFPKGMQDALQAWIAHPKVDVIVAENPTNGGPVGWVGWVRRGFAGDTDLPLDGPDEEPQPETFFTDAEQKQRTKTIDDLGELTNASMNHWVKRFMPEGCKCRFLCTYVVHPDHQRRGIGSALMKWGTDKADREPGVYCWVQSSMGGQKAFERQGFREVGRLEADLDEFADGVKPGGKLASVTGSEEFWGRYSWVYMRRDARA
ncbi:acetyltransferase [Colletotrichum scovillei]|uniref:Acetyltransferase n=1 Tax=Colletotrichum scovillei TaxID=1209932 RepID=A0A9P7R0P3_9PEZI|nr:acetyltransferase [Colletotrichum scovillei]KAF4773074.1 acetyltransferase [Colletotrichum scovillei]KAG7046692.1 acetyltransferase [Colletotrichum scovillei]KAG7056532.1 acetyltransferase [Colletotrichum scovillei]KAG7066460.1 acetyltransferase [Colletotrichum scovillei]